MKLSIFYDHILEGADQSKKKAGEILKLCKSWGIDGLEVNFSHFRDHFEEITGDLTEAGMEVSCLYEFYEFGTNPDPAKAREHLEMARRVGAEKVLVIPGTLSKEEAEELNRHGDSRRETSDYMDRNQKIQNMRQALAGMVEYGRTLGVTVTLEDFDGPVQPFARTYQLLWFMEHVPGLRFTLDTGNFAYSDEDVTKAYEVLKEYIVHVHCKDRADGGEVHRFSRGLGAAAVGSGYLPIGSLVEKMRKQGYDGFLAIEHYGADDQVEYMQRSAEYLRQYIV